VSRTPPGCPGRVYATRHGREGTLLGRITGAIVRDLVIDGETSWDLAPYAVTRFDGRVNRSD
jgi:glycine/D-amino acid oxidase-like deaminating enzyme